MRNAILLLALIVCLSNLAMAQDDPKPARDVPDIQNPKTAGDSYQRAGKREQAVQDDDALVNSQSAGSPVTLHYTDTSAGQSLEHPPTVPIELSTDRPSELSELVAYRGQTQRYGQLRYGTLDSRPVSIVVDELGNRQFDLYLDADRDFVIEPRERVAGSGSERRTQLNAEIRTEDGLEYRTRWVVFRRSVTGRTLGVATAGHLEGKVPIGERSYRVRRVDADGNGLFADARDRLWIDLDDDGRFDPFTEQFPLLPVMEIAGVRYAVRSDPTGATLAFEPLTGEGTIRLVCRPADPDSQIVELSVMFVSKDGSAISLHGLEEAVTVPVGEYIIATVTLAIQSGLDGRLWSFSFARLRHPAEHEWHTVEKDQQTFIDPVGQLRFEISVGGGAESPERILQVRPRLSTRDGLAITSCSWGESSRGFATIGPLAQIQLIGTQGAALYQTSSGFS
jgi:hypothetical protein